MGLSYYRQGTESSSAAGLSTSGPGLAGRVARIGRTADGGQRRLRLGWPGIQVVGLSRAMSSSRRIERRSGGRGQVCTDGIEVPGARVAHGDEAHSPDPALTHATRPVVVPEIRPDPGGHSDSAGRRGRGQRARQGRPSAVAAAAALSDHDDREPEGRGRQDDHGGKSGRQLGAARLTRPGGGPGPAGERVDGAGCAAPLGRSLRL